MASAVSHAKRYYYKMSVCLHCTSILCALINPQQNTQYCAACQQSFAQTSYFGGLVKAPSVSMAVSGTDDPAGFSNLNLCNSVPRKMNSCILASSFPRHILPPKAESKHQDEGQP